MAKIFGYNKHTVGIRVPNHAVARGIVDALGAPIISASIKMDESEHEYITDPEAIYEQYADLVDMVIDSGPSGHLASTIIDCTGTEPVLVREGAGSIVV